MRGGSYICSYTCSDLTWTFLVFCKTGHLREVVATSVLAVLYTC